MTPRNALQFGSRLHFKRCQALPKETPFPFFLGTPFFGTPCFLFFFFDFLSPAKVGSLEMQPGAKLQAYLGVIILQPHACTQRFRLRILRRTRSNAGRTSLYRESRQSRTTPAQWQWSTTFSPTRRVPLSPVTGCTCGPTSPTNPLRCPLGWIGSARWRGGGCGCDLHGSCLPLLGPAERALT